MKTIIFYGRRNTGMVLLPYLLAKVFLVKVISDDKKVLWLARTLGCEIVSFDTMGTFDIFICCHGNKIIEKKYLVEGRMINIHPCLGSYPGHNPIKKFIEDKKTIGTVESQYLIEDVDMGDVIHRETFETGVCNTYADFYNIALPYYFRCLEKTLKILL